MVDGGSHLAVGTLFGDHFRRADVDQGTGHVLTPDIHGRCMALLLFSDALEVRWRLVIRVGRHITRTGRGRLARCKFEQLFWPAVG